MAKKWSEVEQSEGYQSLHEDDQFNAKRQYFDQIVAPQLEGDDIGLAKSQFFQYDPADSGMKNSEYDDLITETAIKNDIPTHLFHKQLRQESGLDPTVTSKAGAVGIGQFMPGTAKEMGITDRTDPVQSIKGAAKYLKKMYKRYGDDWDLALSAYNAGPGVTDKVLKGKRDFKPETVNYLKIIRGQEDINKHAKDFEFIEIQNAHIRAYHDEQRKEYKEQWELLASYKELKNAAEHNAATFNETDKGLHAIAKDGLVGGTFDVAGGVGGTLQYIGGKIESFPGSLEELPEEYSQEAFGMLSPVEQHAVGIVMGEKNMTLGKAIETVLKQQNVEVRKEYSKIGKAVEQVGKVTADYWEKKAKKYGPPPSLADRSVWDEPSLIWNGTWWVYNLARTTPSLAASLLPGAGAGRVVQVAGKAIKMTPQSIAFFARLGQAATAGTAGGSLEASSTYREVLKKTGNKAEAQAAAEMMFFFVAATSAFSGDKLLAAGGKGFINRAKKAGVGALVEGLTESSEEPAEVFAKVMAMIAEGKPVPENIKEMFYESFKAAVEVFPIAGVMGGAATFATATNQDLQKEKDVKLEEQMEALRTKLLEQIEADPQLTDEQRKILIKKAEEELGGRTMPETVEEGEEVEEKRYQEEILKDEKKLTPEDLAEMPQTELEKIPTEERAKIMLGEEATEEEVAKLVEAIEKTQKKLAPKKVATKETIKPVKFTPQKDMVKETAPEIVTNSTGKKQVKAYEKTSLRPVPKGQTVKADGEGAFFERESDRYKDSVDEFKSTAENDVTKGEVKALEEIAQIERELATGTSKYQWFFDEVVKAVPQLNLVVGQPSKGKWNRHGQYTGRVSDNFLRGVSRSVPGLGGVARSTVFLNPKAIAHTGTNAQGVFVHELLHTMVKAKIGFKQDIKHVKYDSAIRNVIATIPKDIRDRLKTKANTYWVDPSGSNLALAPLSKKDKTVAQSFTAFLSAIQKAEQGLGNWEEVLVQAFGSPEVMAELYQIKSAKGGLRKTAKPETIASRLVKIGMQLAGLGKYLTGAKQKIADDLIDVHNEYMEDIKINEQKYADIPHGSIWEDQSVLDLRPFKGFPKGAVALAPAIKEKNGNVWWSNIAHFDITDADGNPRIGTEGFAALDKDGRKSLGFYTREQAGAKVDPSRRVIDPDSGKMASEDVPYIQIDEEHSNVGDKEIFKRDKDGKVKAVTPGKVSREEVRQKKKLSPADKAAIDNFKKKYRKQDDKRTPRQKWAEDRKSKQATRIQLEREAEIVKEEKKEPQIMFEKWNPQQDIAHMDDYKLEMERDRVMGQLASKYGFEAPNHPGRRYYELRLSFLDIAARKMARQAKTKQDKYERSLVSEAGATEKANLRFYTKQYRMMIRTNAPINSVNFVRSQLVNLMGKEEFYAWSGEEAPVIKQRKAKEAAKKKLVEEGPFTEKQIADAKEEAGVSQDTPHRVVKIDPNTYLSLTTGTDLRKNAIIASMPSEIDEAELKKSGASLLVVGENGEVTGHDGRHRAAVHSKAGKKSMSVLLLGNVKAKEIYAQKFGTKQRDTIFKPGERETKVKKYEAFTEEDAKKESTALKGAKTKQEARDVFDRLVTTVDTMIADQIEASDEFLDMATNAMQQAVKKEAADETEIKEVASKLASLITAVDESYENDSDEVGKPHPVQKKFNKWSPVKVKFDAYYAPEDGFVPSGWSFSVVDRTSPAFQASYAIASLDKKTFTDAIKFLEDSRRPADDADRADWKLKKDHSHVTSKDGKFGDDKISIDFDHTRLSRGFLSQVTVGFEGDRKKLPKVGQPATSIVWSLNGSFDRTGRINKKMGLSVIREIRNMIFEAVSGKNKARKTSAFHFSSVFGDDKKTERYSQWVKGIADNLGWEYHIAGESMYTWDSNWEPDPDMKIVDEWEWEGDFDEEYGGAQLGRDMPEDRYGTPEHLAESIHRTQQRVSSILYEYIANRSADPRTELSFDENVVLRHEGQRFDGLKITRSNTGIIAINGRDEIGEYTLLHKININEVDSGNRLSTVHQILIEIKDKMELESADETGEESAARFESETVRQQERIDVTKTAVDGFFQSAGNAIRLGDQPGPLTFTMPTDILYYNVNDGGEYDKIMLTKNTTTNSIEVSVHHPHYDEWMRITEVSLYRPVQDFQHMIKEAAAGIHDGLVHEDTFQQEPDHELETPPMSETAETEDADIQRAAEQIDYMTADEAVTMIREILEEDESKVEKLPFKNKDMEKTAKPMETGFKDDKWFSKLWDGVKDAMSGLREFKYLKRKEHGDVQYALRQLKKGKAAAAREAVRTLKEVLNGLDASQYHNVQRLAYLMDLNEQVKMNEALDAKGEDRTVLANPFNWTDKQIKEETQRYWDVVRSDPQSSLAWMKRQDAWFEIRKTYSESMQAVGFDVTNKIRRPHYFRHQVLEYMMGEHKRTSIQGSGRLAIPTSRSHLKHRAATEGYAMNLNLIQADFEIMTQLVYDTQVALVLEEIMERHGSQEKLEGYELYNPREGAVFHMANTIPGKFLEDALAKGAKTISIPRAQVKQVLALGGKYKGYFLPKELAHTLNEALEKKPTPTWAKVLFKTPMRLWKAWQLISPFRILKYNTRNMTGDAEAVFIGSPAVFKYAPAAVKELWNWKVRDKISPQLQEWIDRGGQETTLQAQEFFEILERPEFSHLRGRKSKIAHALTSTKRFPRAVTDFREMILRYAAYKKFKNEIDLSKSNKPKKYIASLRQEVDALRDNADKAFLMSNDLLGAYDRVSQAGEGLRAFVAPFWSFQEVNMKRTAAMFQNAINDDSAAYHVGKKMGVAGVVGAIKVGKLAMKLLLFSVIVGLWNNLKYPDAEDALPEEMRERSHVIIWETEGKAPEIIYFPRIGIVGDLLEWGGMDTLPSNIVDLILGTGLAKSLGYEGNAGKEWSEIVASYNNGVRNFEDVTNKVVQMIGPQYKMPVELLMGEKVFPSIWNRQPISDRWKWLFDNFQLGGFYDNLAGKPQRRDWAKRMASTTAIYHDDKRRLGWLAIQQKLADYRRRAGLKGRGFIVTDSGQALYNMGLAWRYGDREAYVKYLAEYVKVTVDKFGEVEIHRRMEEQWEKLNPLEGLNDTHQAIFYDSLDKRDKVALKLALEYYLEIKAGVQFLEEGEDNWDEKNNN